MADERAQMRISSDDLEASIAIHPGESANEEALRAWIAEANVVHGIDEEMVALLGEHWMAIDQEVRAARFRYNAKAGGIVMERIHN
jgi:hypothetical protein